MSFLQRSRNLGSLLLAVVFCNGCASMSHTDKGVLGGGAVGGATGAAIGHALGNTGLGAVAGTLVGAVAGGAVGNSMDNMEKRHQQDIAAVSANAAQGPMHVQDVVQLTHAHTSEQIIINQIVSTGSVFRLTTEDIQYLKANGVTDRVISEMQATASRTPQRRYYVREPVDREYIYVRDYAPPPRVSLGYTYMHGGGHRCR